MHRGLPWRQPRPAQRAVSDASGHQRKNAHACQGHARCYALAPELFEVDDYGQSTVIGDGVVPEALADKARLAVANCPEYAIEEIAD